MLLAFAIANGVFAYWALARTPVQPLTGRNELILAGLSWFFVATAVLLGGAAALAWVSRQGRGPATLRPWADLVQRLPLWCLAMPVAVSASLVAARMGLTSDLTPNFWPALVLWLAAMLFVVVVAAAPDLPARPLVSLGRPTFSRAVLLECALVVGLTCVALAMRAIEIADAPPLVHGDEEIIGADALQIVEGVRTDIFGVGFGANPMVGYLILGVFLKIFGADIVGVRLASAVLGAAAVPATYLLLRAMFGRVPATVGAVFLAGYHLHLHMSRIGINVVWDTALLASTLFFTYRATTQGRAYQYALAGILAALGLYLYHGSRVIPIIVVAYIGFVTVRHREFLRAHLGGLTLGILAFFVAAMPLGAFFLSHPDLFFPRLETTGIFQSGWFGEQQDLGRSAVSILWGEVRESFGGLLFYGEASAFSLYDEPTPLVGGLAAIFFIAGVAYALLHVFDRRYAMLLLIIVIPTFLGGVLTVGPNNGQRLMGTIPGIAGLVAVGVWELSNRVVLWPKRLVVPVALVVAAVLAGVSADAYFDAATGDRRYGGTIMKMGASYISSLPEETRVYWYASAAVSSSFAPLSARDHDVADVADWSQIPLSPPTQLSPSAFIFLPISPARLGPIRESCPGGEIREITFDGDPVLVAYEVLEPNFCFPVFPPPDNFDDALVIRESSTEFSSMRVGTVQTGEPAACGTFARTVWMRFAPPSDGVVIAGTAGSHSTLSMGVYSGSSLDTLRLVACGEESTNQRAIQVPVRQGVAYHFQIGSTEAAGPNHVDLVRFNLNYAADDPVVP